MIIADCVYDEIVNTAAAKALRAIESRVAETIGDVGFEAAAPSFDGVDMADVLREGIKWRLGAADVWPASVEAE